MSQIGNHKKTIKQRYNELGGSLYDLRYTEEQEAKYELILDELESFDLLLDNGCGTGLLFPLLNSPAIGLDLSANLLKKAKERVGSDNFLVLGDSENLPFRGDIFDVVVSMTVIQNLSKPKKLLSESSRVSLLGAKIIVSSLKRVYADIEDIIGLVENEYLRLDRVFSDDKVNDWITVSTRIK